MTYRRGLSRLRRDDGIAAMRGKMSEGKRPADLRRLAQIELWRVLGRSKMLKDLLRAEPLIEYSDEHRRNMLQRLSLMHDTFGNPPAGFNDGSGGGVGENRPDGASCGTSSSAQPGP
jgi:hypothetical protein